ncbi:hypothetical protein JST97_26715 [bacterium]|nr:hypothetical protein [bacterium]
MVSRALLWSFVVSGTLVALGFSALQLELARRIWVHQGDPLVWALFEMAILPCTLAGWAVPLAVAYRLRYDRRRPAGLPSGPGFLMAHYRSPFWRGYASLFACSLCFWLVYLVAGNWVLVGAEFLLLLYVSARAYTRQARLNREQMLVIEPDGVRVPPFGKIARQDFVLEVREELTVTPKRDQLSWWVTVNGRKWKNCALPEHAQEIVDWLRGAIIPEKTASASPTN